MNPRVLELLKNPKNIQSEDLNLLKEEIDSFPFIQNIRALHLYGIHLYDKANYQKELSTTAAYTTDKKILYQLINGKIQQKQNTAEELVAEEQTQKAPKNTFSYTYKSQNFPLKREDKIAAPAENPAVAPIEQLEFSEIPENEFSEKTAAENKYAEAASLVQNNTPESVEVYVNGERNRILFEGEENFLSEENYETIDLESTLESGSIVTYRPKSLQIENDDQETASDVSAEPQATEEESGSEKNTGSENKSDEEITGAQADTGISEVEPIIADIDISPDTPEQNTEEEKEEQIISRENSENLLKEEVEFTSETIIDGDKIASEEVKDIVKEESDISFHETQSFLPDVIIPSDTAEKPELISGNTEPVESNSEVDPNKVPGDQQKSQNEETSAGVLNKHEEEIRRLIEQVERKMKESRKVSDEQKTDEPETAGNDNISFAETQNFDIVSAEEEIEEKVPETTQDAQDEEIIIVHEPEAEKEIINEWKPMSFEAHVPDSLIYKEQTASQPEEKVNEPEISEKENTVPEKDDVREITEDQGKQEMNDHISEIEEESVIPEQKENEAPVMNVSFFSSDISRWSSEKTEPEPVSDTEKEKQESPEVKVQSPVDSNVPGFINTWQSWLKIDRHEEEPVPVEDKKEIVEIKNKVIETFIENNPRISQLKEESAYVIKERNDDISHLMTETLATLYFEQKLYTKAIKAFEILIRKTPEKKAYFEERIQKIKDFRSKN